MSGRWSSLITHGQDNLIARLGCPPGARRDVFVAMLRRDPRESTGYWLQLVIALGIATLGLVLGSTAVIIGAMLVAPLMGPIVALGMGLAAGAPFLVLRSAGRILGSVAVVIACAAGITLALPFHEVTGEIAARTAPTALDLVTAAFCALAGVVAVLRRDSDTATTAAGTSIGISLVPPLCASGFGLGTGDGTVASGAALLFLTNLVAIVVVGAGAFALVGFHQLPVAELEAGELGAGEPTVTRGLARRLAAAFAHRRGRWLRVLMPAVLLGAVYVPLRRALDEVSWQVRVRTAAQRALQAVGPRLLQPQVQLGRERVDVTATFVGSAGEARSLGERLTREIAAAAGVVPHVELAAVADASALEGLRGPAPVVVTPPPPEVPATELLQTLAARVARRWPAGSAGALAAASARAADGGLVVEAVHLGAPLGDAARETLGGVLSEDLGFRVSVEDRPVPAATTVLAGSPAGLARLLAEAQRAGLAGADRLCLTAPAPRGRRGTGVGAALRAELPASLEIEEMPGSEATYRFAAGPCGGEASAAGREP